MVNVKKHAKLKKQRKPNYNLSNLVKIAKKDELKNNNSKFEQQYEAGHKSRIGFKCSDSLKQLIQVGSEFEEQSMSEFIIDAVIFYAENNY